MPQVNKAISVLRSRGGKPTLAGLAFFESFVEFVRRYNRKQLPVTYAIQTNGYAVDEKWAAFLAKNRFLVGISVDGDKALHDEFRIDTAGKGTWMRTQKACACCKRRALPVIYSVL